MLVQLYHGSSNFSTVGGYAGGKPNSFQYGTGLYCTNSYQWANNYGRRRYVLDVELDRTQSAHNVEIPIITLQYWVNYYCTKKFAKLFSTEFKARESLTAERFEIFILWHIRSITKLSVPLAALFAANGCTHSIENGDYSGMLVRIFDFSIIKGYTTDKKVLQSLEYKLIEIPKEVHRYPR